MLSNELKRTTFSKEKVLSNRRGQIGETLTWVVATLIIIFVLIIFIYASVALGKAKSVNPKKLQIKEGDSVEDISWIEVKTLIAKTLNIENENEIDVWISEAEDE